MPVQRSIGYLLSASTTEGTTSRPVMIGNPPRLVMVDFPPRPDLSDLPYDVIKFSFITVSNNGTASVDYSNTTQAELQALKDQGKEVWVSLGGPAMITTLESDIERDRFISSIEDIFTAFDFDGLDVALSNVLEANETVPLDGNQGDSQRYIDAIKTLFTGSGVLASKGLSFSPEIVSTLQSRKLEAGEPASIGGAYGLGFGSYLPFIKQVLDTGKAVTVTPQMYQQGGYDPILALDGENYYEGTHTFIIEGLRLLAEGFTITTLDESFPALGWDNVGFIYPATDDIANADLVSPYIAANAYWGIEDEVGFEPASYGEMYVSWASTDQYRTLSIVNSGLDEGGEDLETYEDQIRFFLGNLSTDIISSEDMQRIINMQISRFGDDSCKVLYYSTIEVLRWLIRKSAQGQDSTLEGDGQLKRVRVKEGGYEEEREFYEDGSAVDSDWSSVLLDLQENPTMIGCDPVDKPEKGATSIVMIGGTSKKEFEEVRTNQDSRNGLSGHQSSMPWRQGINHKWRY